MKNRKFCFVLGALSLSSLASCNGEDDRTDSSDSAGTTSQGGSSSGGTRSTQGGTQPDGTKGGNDAVAGEPAVGGMAGAAGEATVATPLYALNSVVYGEELTSTYLSLLETLDAGEVGFEDAREFPGTADIWWHEGSLFVTDGESQTMTKFDVEDGALKESAKISFANYGITSLGFWLNSFVAPDKAYVLNGADEYVVWNPETMEIGGTIALPKLPLRGLLKPFGGYSDRAAVVRNGLLYQPFYYTDATYFQFDAGSSIVVIDTESDQVVDTIEAPCPGLDFVTRDEQDNLYFSSWVFAPGGSALLSQPATCVAEIAAGADAATKLFEVADVTDGRHGGALRYLGDGMALMSVLHPEHSTASSVSDIAYGPNWHFWLYDLAQGTASEVEDIDWNAGAAYDMRIGGQLNMLVPAGDYASTALYSLATDGTATPRLTTKGWSLRAFQLQ